MLVMEPPGNNPSQIVLFLCALFYAISHQEAFEHIGLRTGHNAPIRRTIIEGRQRPFYYATFKIVVEHDEDTMLAADYLVDIGPGPGDLGGKIIAEGTPKESFSFPSALRQKKSASQNPSAPLS